MLATYQAKIVNNQLEWIDTPPNFDDVYVTVTVFPDFNLKSEPSDKPKRQPPQQLQGLIKTQGDIFDMSDSYQAWEHFK